MTLGHIQATNRADYASTGNDVCGEKSEPDVSKELTLRRQKIIRILAKPLLKQLHLNHLLPS